nr:uncharacterized protein LOC129524256 [Gorilla gorilla gorilla]
MAGGNRHFVHGGGKRKMRKTQKQKPLIKPSDLVRLTHDHENIEGNHLHGSNYLPPGPPPRTTHGHYRSTILDEISERTQSETISQDMNEKNWKSITRQGRVNQEVTGPRRRGSTRKGNPKSTREKANNQERQEHLTLRKTKSGRKLYF